MAQSYFQSIGGKDVFCLTDKASLYSSLQGFSSANTLHIVAVQLKHC